METCAVCLRGDYLMEVPNSPTGEIFCGNPIHGDDAPAWVPADLSDDDDLD